MRVRTSTVPPGSIAPVAVRAVDSVWERDLHLGHVRTLRLLVVEVFVLGLLS